MKIRNTDDTPVTEITRQMNEMRPLPLGRQEFDDWAERIIAGAMNPASHETQKAALAQMILHLGPTESHKQDAYFIHSLRKAAANQVAHAVWVEIEQKIKAEKEAEEAKKKAEEANAAE